jgi:hypothetical protein
VRFVAAGLASDHEGMRVRVSSVSLLDQAAVYPALRSLHTAVFVPPPAAAPLPPVREGGRERDLQE